MSRSDPKISFETGVYRPPSEGGSDSLLIRVTRNCPWNHCTFCGMYKTDKFQLRSVHEVKSDIDAIAALRDGLDQVSRELGAEGRLNPEVANRFIAMHPELARNPGTAMVYHWILAGCRTAFLQDADSLIMKSEDMVEILTYLRRRFPQLTRVTTYARSKTLAKKPAQELIAIQEAGLDRVHVGLESGDDEVLKRIKKGATGEIHITGGKKALEAGFQLSEYWMPGLGGDSLWKQHAINTARVLSAINPDYIRSRPLNIWPDTPLNIERQQGLFNVMTPRDLLVELRTTVEHLDVTSRVCFDHAGNFWKNARGGHLLSMSYEGYQFPDEKTHMLEIIDQGLGRSG